LFAPIFVCSFSPCLQFHFFSKFFLSFLSFYYCFMYASVFFYVFALQIFYAIPLLIILNFIFHLQTMQCNFLPFVLFFPLLCLFFFFYYFCNVYY
jgi:hypothetical protein